MLWVECCSYVGPDRRRGPTGLRIRERRRENHAGAPPPLARELRNLRFMVIDARGSTGVSRFADRVNSIALLAESCDELTIADILSGLAASLLRDHDRDVRPFVYEQLDRLHSAQVVH